jgi:hypothetical protein
MDWYVDELTIMSILYLDILKSKICTTKPRNPEELSITLLML